MYGKESNVLTSSYSIVKEECVMATKMATREITQIHYDLWEISPFRDKLISTHTIYIS